MVRDFLEIHDAHIFFFQKGEMYLKLNDLDPESTGEIISKLSQEKNNLDTRCFSQDIPRRLWALPGAGTGKIKSVTRTPITVDNSLPLPLFTITL